MMDYRLVALIVAAVFVGFPALADAQTTSSEETLIVRPADDSAALGEVAPAPTARQALTPRATPGPMIAPGSQFKNGYYRGVVPGESHIPPRARRLKSTRGNLVTWPGFEMTQNGSRVFIQSTRPVSFRRETESDRIIIVLENTKVHLKNNRNPLVTEHFNTPLARAYLQPQGRNTQLVLEMKVDASASIRQQTEGEYHFLFVEFPSGTYPIPQGVRAPSPRGEGGRITVDRKKALKTTL